MKLYCPQCREPVPAAAIDLFADQARCEPCSESFAYLGLMARARRPAAKKPPAPRPDGFRTDRDGQAFSWPCLFPLAFSLLLVFGLLWCAMLGGMVWFMFRHDPPPFLAALMLLMWLPHGLVGLGMIYYALASLLGRRRLSVGPLELRLRQWPLPLPRLACLNPAEVAQFFCRPRRRFRASDGVTYELCAWLKSGHEIVIDHFVSYEQGLWLEQQLEPGLGIEDRGVRGEGGLRA